MQEIPYYAQSLQYWKKGLGFIMLLKRREEDKKYLNNRGFTLIELLVGISILAIIAVPLFNNFVTAAKVNARAKRTQDETLLTQNILEEIKAKSVSEIAREFNYPEDFGITDSQRAEMRYDETSGYVQVTETEKSSRKKTITKEDGTIAYQYELNPPVGVSYYFAMKDIAYGGRSYDAMITVDPAAYATSYNSFPMPIISQINTNTNVLAVQSFDNDLPVSELYHNHVAYCMELEARHRDDETPPTITYSSKEEISITLNKEIHVNIAKIDGEVSAQVDFIYSSPIDGTGTVTYSVANQKLVDAAGDIYIFYLPSFSDKLSINRVDFNTEDPVTEIYLIKQASALDSSFEEFIGFPPSGIELYSNADFGIWTKKLVKKETPQNRIYKVKVQLYKAGVNFHPDGLCTEFTTTKED